MIKLAETTITVSFNYVESFFILVIFLRVNITLEYIKDENIIVIPSGIA